MLKRLRFLTLIIFLGSLISCSCSKDKTYAPKELWFIAYEADPNIELVPIVDPQKRILCKNYGVGCVKGSGKRIKVNLVELIVVQFETQEQAKNEAKRLDQYYVRNWLFDDVKNEPVLKEFVTKVFDAQNPQK